MEMADKYPNFAALQRAEPPNHWRIAHLNRQTSGVLIVAPHGGGIEPRTSQIATEVAGDDYSFYCFEGIKRTDNTDLHITSHHFDEPTALSLAAQSSVVLGVHGCRGNAAIYIGGLDAALVESLTSALRSANLPASSTDHPFPAIEPNNICNRGSRGRGAQLEITFDLRQSASARAQIVLVARDVIGKYLPGVRVAS